MSTQKPVHDSVYSSFIHNSLNLEKPRCPSVSEQINKHPDNKIVLSTKRSELSSLEKTWKSLKSRLLSKGSQSEKPTYYMTPSI